MARWDSFDAFLAEAGPVTSAPLRQALVNQLLAEIPVWPWVEDGKATFIYGGEDVQTVALNLDTIKADPPFAPMNHLEGTSLWYITRNFAPDDLLDYLLAVDDPMTPLATEPDVAGRIASHWRPDPRNPLRMNTAQTAVSVLRMSQARPFPDWSAMPNVPRGRLDEHPLDSSQLGFNGRKLWVYTPPGYDGTGLAYPLLVLQDGQWMNGPLQVPQIADALIKHNRLQPLVIAMMQSGDQQERDREFSSNDRHYQFILTELLPLVQTQYRVDSSNVAIGGVAVGAVAAAHAALKNPAVFAHLLMISPPQMQDYASRIENAETLPNRIFQSVGRYEARGRFIKPALALRDLLQRRSGVAYKFVETGSGHGLVGFRSILPEALAWVFPGGVG
jgi:enterochelin esterase family protein